MSALSESAIRAAMKCPLEEADLVGLGRKYRGKVRENYTNGATRIIIVTDRISAFDRNIGTLPLKGQLLNHVATWWFEQSKHLVPNHLIQRVDPNAVLVHECTPLPVEMVVRNYLTGSTSTSIWVHYSQGARSFCGHALADGMRRNQRLPEPILTPSTKAPQGDHDISASREEILEWTGMPPEHFDQAAKLAMKLFEYGQQVCAERGLILVDTKYEFGFTPEGQLVVMDEIHTPDSSRFWYSNSYAERFEAGLDPESFDKEYVRHWLRTQDFAGDGPVPLIPDEVRVEATKRYAHAVDALAAGSFEPNLEDPLPRLVRNLAAFGAKLPASD